MTIQRRTLGQHGEGLAVAYLQQQGYGIIATNWRCRTGEIDIIAVDGPSLVFVEVRTRRSTLFGHAEESVTPSKQRRLVALVQAYLQTLEEAQTAWPGPWRIDVVALQLSPGQPVCVQHLQHAVEEV
jgi:putative endonuclease